MTLWRLAVRTQARHAAADHIRAVVATSLVPAATAALVLWLFPAGCDIRGDAATYRWTCLLPGLMIIIPPAAALLLPIAVILNDRWARPLPDGWLVTIVSVGILSQGALSGSYLLVLDAAYRRLFVAEVIFIPQPFVAGAVAGAVYWAVLHWKPLRR